jgi:hypothetical protein
MSFENVQFIDISVSINIENEEQYDIIRITNLDIVEPHYDLYIDISRIQENNKQLVPINDKKEECYLWVPLEFYFSSPPKDILAFYNYFSKLKMNEIHYENNFNEIHYQNNFKWVNNIGHNLLKSIDITMGDKEYENLIVPYHKNYYHEKPLQIGSSSISYIDIDKPNNLVVEEQELDNEEHENSSYQTQSSDTHNVDIVDTDKIYVTAYTYNMLIISSGACGFSYYDYG